jgi:hypothetical protein
MGVPTRAQIEAADASRDATWKAINTYTRTAGMTQPANSTPSEARRAELLGNAEWVKKYMSGDKAAAAELDALDREILNTPHPGPTDAEMAQVEKDDLMVDPDWIAKYMRGDSKAVAQMTALNERIVKGRRR